MAGWPTCRSPRTTASPRSRYRGGPGDTYTISGLATPVLRATTGVRWSVTPGRRSLTQVSVRHGPASRRAAPRRNRGAGRRDHQARSIAARSEQHGDGTRYIVDLAPRRRPADAVEHGRRRPDHGGDRQRSTGTTKRSTPIPVADGRGWTCRFDHQGRRRDLTVTCRRRNQVHTYTITVTQRRWAFERRDRRRTVGR